MKASLVEEPCLMGAGRLEHMPSARAVAFDHTTNNQGNDNEDENEPLQAIPHHPLGVRPSGNQYTATVNSRLHTGYFQMLPDEFLQGLLDYLTVDASLLLSLGSTCKALYAFCSADDLWKTVFTKYVCLPVSHHH